MVGTSTFDDEGFYFSHCLFAYYLPVIVAHISVMVALVVGVEGGGLAQVHGVVLLHLRLGAAGHARWKHSWNYVEPRSNESNGTVFLNQQT